MAINPNIALGVKGIELQDPLAQYGRVAAIQGAQQQNALAQMQMQQAQREIEQQNRLREFIPTMSAENRNQLLGYGAAGRQVYESLIKGEKESREAQKAEADIAATRMKQARDLLPSVNSPEAYANWRSYTLKNLPGLSGIIPEQYSPDAVRGLMLEADKALEQHFVSQNLGGGQQVVAMPKYGQGPAQVVPGSYVEDMPLPAAVEAQKSRIAKAGAPTVVNVQEKAEAGAFGKLLVDQYDAISKQAAVGARTKPALDANLAILDKGFDTGFGTEAKAAGAKVLAALGVANADKYATNAQQFLGNASQAVLQRQLEQKGPQTEADAQRITQTGAQLGNTKTANRFFIEVAKEQINRDIEQRKFYDEWKKKTGSFQGAEDAWFSGEGGASLFDRPSLKKYLPQEPQVLQQDRRKGLGEIFGAPQKR